MTTPLTFLANRSLDRRNLIRGAAALAATAMTVTTASAATAPPLGQIGAPTLSTDPLPLGPLSGSRYPDAHLESAKPQVSFGPAGFPAFAVLPELGRSLAEVIFLGYRVHSEVFRCCHADLLKENS